MVVVVLAVALAITGYVGWLMWHAPDSAPPSETRTRKAQLRDMKRRLAAVMREQPGQPPSRAGRQLPTT